MARHSENAWPFIFAAWPSGRGSRQERGAHDVSGHADRARGSIDALVNIATALVREVHFEWEAA